MNTPKLKNGKQGIEKPSPKNKILKYIAAGTVALGITAGALLYPWIKNETIHLSDIEGCTSEASLTIRIAPVWRDAYVYLDEEERTNNNPLFRYESYPFTDTVKEYRTPHGTDYHNSLLDALEQGARNSVDRTVEETRQEYERDGIVGMVRTRVATFFSDEEDEPEAEEGSTFTCARNLYSRVQEEVPGL